MKLTFLGSGDAFGTGGRFNTCFHVETAAGAHYKIDELPVDSHQFIALVAPRPIFIGGGDLIMEPGMIPGDAWQDAKGMFMAAAAASPAWEFYGKKGLPSATMPKIETVVDSGSVAFRQHLYGHTAGPNWSYFLAFADKEFARQK